MQIGTKQMCLLVTTGAIPKPSSLNCALISESIAASTQLSSDLLRSRLFSIPFVKHIQVELTVN